MVFKQGYNKNEKKGKKIDRIKINETLFFSS